ncbi:Transcriptional repressor [Granulibacter bethesdensis]|uniref:Transcriptional repressor n=1 Tax=Granulibacter bethesdensis TaxID=364410 RepID=A0AAC9KEW6_9PROT|nr:LexA family transcriptional regulator [Granulibacter bethesdensis]APH54885.1 Transcriptional repressor [Granulibacter bethesdensis]APH62471.1 Transcriptional repressor [Granulibacter bethesdensis]
MSHPSDARSPLSFPTEMTVGERMRHARLQRGWSQDALAKEAGTSQTTIDKIERNLTQRSRALPRLAQCLGVDLLTLDPDYLGDYQPVPPGIAAPPSVMKAEAPPPPPATFQSQARIPDQPIPPPITGFSPRNVPVFGTAQGGALGATGLPDSAQALDWARLPAPLTGIPGLFALYVEGDSMEPWVEHGHLIYIHPTRPAAPRDHVVVVVQDGEYDEPRALLKRLVRRTTGRLVLHQYNPAGEIEIDARTVMRIYRVIPWNEVAGV